ncbi:MAG: YitT family protein [Lachnospiraceae bacterium]
MEKYKNHTITRRMITLIAVILSALLQVYVIQTMVWPANLLSGGFTGLALLTDQWTSLYGIGISTSVAMIVLNVPVAFLCSKSISIRFTVFSLLQVGLASLFLKVLSFEALFDDVLLNAVFGGFFYGLSVAIALRGNASTGGTDFIALYVSNKTGKSIWEYVFFGNVILLCIFGYLFGWDHAGYSILFQFISTKTIANFHHRYERVTLQITTAKADEIMKQYVSQYRHGISCAEVVGGYSRKQMYLLHTVVSSYEVEEMVHMMGQIDPHIIINMFKTENFHGKFYHAPMK